MSGSKISVDFQQSWESIAKAALLGTGRSGFSLSPATGDLSPAAQGEGDEQRLLNLAGTLAITRQAAEPPTSPGLAPLTPAMEETKAFLSPAVSNRYFQLRSSNKDLLPEWLAVASRTGKVAPASLLPDLLEVARGSKEQRKLIVPLLGERGRWLAELNPDWRTVAGVVDEDLEKTWQFGSLPARIEALRDLRQEEPAKAREWLEASWAQEDARERGKLAEVLEINLSQDDEPFLEAALDDKRAEVRDVARNLLPRLPKSRFVQRMFTQAKAFVELKNGKIQVTLPEKYEKSWKRDGIQEKVPAYENKVGERAYWLRQFLETIPSALWRTDWQMPPEAIFDAAKGDWKDLLISAWRESAARSRDTQWCEFFLKRGLADRKQADERLLQALPLERAETIVGEILDTLITDNTRLDYSHLSLVQWLPTPWSPDISRKVLKIIYKEIQRDQDTRQAFAYYHLNDLGTRLNPSIIRELTDFWPEDHPHWPIWQPYIQNMQDKIHFRHEMLQELTA